MDPGYQGIVALNDHDLSMGCHRNLPGCVAHLAAWTKEHRYPYSDKARYRQYDARNMTYLRKSHKPEPDDAMCRFLQTLPMRQGSLVVCTCKCVQNLI